MEFLAACSGHKGSASPRERWRTFAQGKTIQQTPDHVSDHLLDHIKVVLFTLQFPDTMFLLVITLVIIYIEIHHAHFETSKPCRIQTGRKTCPCWIPKRRCYTWHNWHAPSSDKPQDISCCRYKSPSSPTEVSSPSAGSTGHIVACCSPRDPTERVRLPLRCGLRPWPAPVVAPVR